METITRQELYELIAELKVEIRKLNSNTPRYISRRTVIGLIGPRRYQEAVNNNLIHPIKGKARNSKVLIEKAEYENYISYSKRRNTAI